MEYRKLGATDLEVSSVGLGTWAIGGDFYGDVEDSQSIAAIQAALDSGINLVDTAPAYGAGHSEEVVGKAIKGRRDEVVLATKVGVIRHPDSFERNLDPESVRKQTEESLQRLGVDTIDLFQIHWPDPERPLEPALEVLKDLQEAGKFRHLGVSNFDTGLMDQVRAVMPLAGLQPHYSLLKRDIEEQILPYCGRNDIGVLGYGTLAGGLLTGKFEKQSDFTGRDHRSEFYSFADDTTWPKVQELLAVLRAIADNRGVAVAEVTINWTRQQLNVTSALVGAKDPRQARANAAAAEWTLSDDELTRIDMEWRRLFAE